MPGRCPSCNQTYPDESLTFCPNDGTPLVREAPPAYDPQAGMYGAQQPPAPGNYPPSPPPPQQPYNYGAQQQQPGGQAPPPPPPPGWQQPYGQQQQQYPPQYGSPAPGGKSKMPIIIAVLALVLIGGGIGLYFLLRDNSSSTANTNTTTPTSSPTATRSPGSTTTSTFPTPSTTTTTTSPTVGSYTDDEKHRLFQTVGITRDNALIIEVAQKIGIVDSKGQPNTLFQPFLKEHVTWQSRNLAWAQEYRDPQKAREYVMAHK